MSMEIEGGNSMIPRGSTPTLKITVTADGTIVDFSEYSKVEFYLSESKSDLEYDAQTDQMITLDKTRMTFNADHTITVSLTQTETLKFTKSVLYYQIRALDSTGHVTPTSIGAIAIGRILKGGQL